MDFAECDIIKHQDKRINELFVRLTPRDKDFFFFWEQKYSQAIITLRDLNEKRISLLTFIVLTSKESTWVARNPSDYKGWSIDKIITCLGLDLMDHSGLPLRNTPTLADLVKKMENMYNGR